MKRSLFNILLIVFFAISLNAQEICNIGLKYQKSNNKNWGFSMPVVTDVVYESPAHKANIKVGDIILSIDNIETQTLTIGQINQLLQSKDTHKIIRVKNISGVRDILLTKQCHIANSVSEEQLARAFSFYSMRDVCDRLVMYPIKFQSDVNFDFGKIKTFAFVKHDSITETDNTIMSVINNMLISKGLNGDNVKPDALIDIFYSIKEKNPDSISDEMEETYTCRFNFATQDMDRLPILNIGSPSDLGRYTVSFGVKVMSATGKNAVIWTAKSEDLCFDSIPMTYYACSVLPLMFRGFPYIEKPEFPTYLFNKRRYNYTGIRFEAGNINHVVEVDDFSPAYNAGIKPGDNIVSINGIDITNTNQKDITQSYIKFIKETDRYRLPLEYSFRDANGLASCRYWDDKNKNDIANIFVNNKYNTPFSYLFFFRDYINPEGAKGIVFKIERNGNEYPVIVSPILKDYTNISIKQ